MVPKGHEPWARYLHIFSDRSPNDEGEDDEVDVDDDEADDDGGNLKLAATARGGGKRELDKGIGSDKEPFLDTSALPK